MPRIISNLDEKFIGVVKAYNTTTRELDVYIPKLMPAIPEDREATEISTNLAMIPDNIGIKYNTNIKLVSTVKIPAKDMDQEIPKVGSRVIIEFLDGNPQKGYWSKWNYNNDYEIIDEEKYPKYFSIKLGDKELDINKEDKFEITLPDDFSIMDMSDSTMPKTKSYLVKQSDRIEKRVKVVEDLVGQPEATETYTDSYGAIKTIHSDPTGLFSMILKLQNQITELQNVVSIPVFNAGDRPTPSKELYGRIIRVVETYYKIVNGESVATNKEVVYICRLNDEKYEWVRISED